MTAAQHAVYAPSSAHRWMRCTASAEAISRLPPQEEGEEAAKGTAAHEEIEHLLGDCNDVEIDPAVVVPAAQRAIDPNHPAAYGIALLLDYVRQLPPGMLYIEQRVRLTDEIWGRCDVAHWDAATATLTIVDYKNGYVGVDAEENEQLRIYAGGTIYTHQLPAKWIRYAIVQPNDFRPVPRVKQWAESAEQLHAFLTRAAAVPTGPKSFAAGEQCTYCPMFGKCGATRDILARLGQAMTLSPDDVRADQVALFMAMQKPVADWFKALDAAKLKRALGGDVPEGMKVVTTTKHREWKPGVEEIVRTAIIAAHGVKALPLPTPAQAEKLGVDVNTLSQKPEGGPALAVLSDKRPAFTQKSVEKMFAGVTGGAS